MRTAKGGELRVPTTPGSDGGEFVIVEIAILNIVGEEFGRLTLRLSAISMAFQNVEHGHWQAAKHKSADD